MFLPHHRRPCLRPNKTDKTTLVLIFIFLDKRVRTPAQISSGEVTGVQTQDVRCLPSVWFAAAAVASQPGGMTVIRTWKQAEIPNQGSDSNTVVQIALPSIYSSHFAFTQKLRNSQQTSRTAFLF
jgi:hypothetical protein